MCDWVWSCNWIGLNHIFQGVDITPFFLSHRFFLLSFLSSFLFLSFSFFSFTRKGVEEKIEEMKNSFPYLHPHPFDPESKRALVYIHFSTKEEKKIKRTKERKKEEGIVTSESNWESIQEIFSTTINYRFFWFCDFFWLWIQSTIED